MLSPPRLLTVACVVLLGSGCTKLLGFDDVGFGEDGGSSAEAGVDGAAGSGGSIDAGGTGGGVDSGDSGQGGSGGGAGAAGAAGLGGASGHAGASGTGGASGGTGGTGGTAGADAGTAGTGATAGTGGTGGTTEPPPLDLGSVTWLHTNVSNWSVTVNLASVTFQGSQICLNHDIASKNWPIKEISGTEVVANPWVFIYHNDRWYGATWEWLRPPGQTCKNQSSVAGDHIKASPFDEASGWKPTSGETLYFMVSGLARLGLSNVQERSQPVKVVWP